MFVKIHFKGCRSIRLISLLITTSLISTLVFAQATIRITIIGDSTVCNYAASKYPQTGWGQVLEKFFTAGSVTINNRAIGGRSTRSFYQEGRWAEIAANLQKDEYVFIQFGHNDRDYSKEERYTDTTDYKEYLRKYVKESRQKGAIPVFISPMNMNAWNGTIVREVFCEGANNYRGAMMNVASELTVPFIDLEKKSVSLQKRMGQNYCAKFIYLGLDPGEYTNYPDGVADGTHFQEMGANFMAKFVCEGISELKSNTDMAKLAALLKPLYKVNIISDKSITGMVTESGNTFPEEVSVTLKVKQNTGNKFSGWYDSSGKRVTTATIYTFTMKAADLTYSTDQSTNIINKLPENSNKIMIDYTINSIKYAGLPTALVRVDLFSLNAQRIFTTQDYSENGEFETHLPIQKMKSGCYLVKMTIDGNEISDRLYFKK